MQQHVVLVVGSDGLWSVIDSVEKSESRSKVRRCGHDWMAKTIGRVIVESDNCIRIRGENINDGEPDPNYSDFWCMFSHNLKKELNQKIDRFFDDPPTGFTRDDVSFHIVVLRTRNIATS